MKKMIWLVLLSIAVGAASAADKPAGLEELKSVDAVAAEITSFFPKTQGEVKNVTGSRVDIAGLGSKNGLVPGVTLMLWRDGREILHPVTGAVIGRVEDEVGAVELTSVAETSCTAVVKEKKKDPRAGDKARITPKKINLAILPIQASNQKIIQALTDRLADLGRFTVLPTDRVSAYLGDRKERDTALIGAMAKEFSLDVVAVCSAYPTEGGKVLLTTKLYYTGETRPFETILAILDLQQKKEIISEIQPYFAPVLKDDKAGISDLPFEARFMVAADFERRGKPQYAFSDGQRIHIYSQGASGWSAEWAEPAIADIADRQHVNIDAADINGNGVPELFVTVLRKNSVSSYVLEYQNGAFHRIAEVPAFLRVLSYPGKGVLLLGQSYSLNSFFAGRPKIYTWSSGTYAPDRELPLPKGLNLYGFAVFQSEETGPLVVTFDDKDRLVVYSRGSAIWKSEESYPSVPVSANKSVSTSSAVISQSVADADASQKIKITGRILAADLDGDGREEIILPKNIASAYIPSFVNSELVSLAWNGARLEKRWSVAEIGGPVMDYQVVKGETTGVQVLGLIQIPGGLFAADHYRVQNYATR